MWRQADVKKDMALWKLYTLLWLEFFQDFFFFSIRYEESAEDNEWIVSSFKHSFSFLRSLKSRWIWILLSVHKRKKGEKVEVKRKNEYSDGESWGRKKVRIVYRNWLNKCEYVPSTITWLYPPYILLKYPLKGKGKKVFFFLLCHTHTNAHMWKLSQGNIHKKRDEIDRISHRTTLR